MQQALFTEEDSTLLNEFGYKSLTGRVVGVDEVGRGPLIGDVVTAAVILPKGCDLPLKDSKKLSEKKRLELSEKIKEQAVAYSICFATPEEIDELNILQATMLAMQRAVEDIYHQCQDQSIDIESVYFDGNRCPSLNGLHLPFEAVVKGDDKVMEISAASILAKVHRDQQMIDLDQRLSLIHI